MSFVIGASRYLGIDPSLAASGFVVMEERDGGNSCEILEAGTIKTRADQPIGERLGHIQATVSSVMSMYKPANVSMEGYAMGAKFNREAMGEVGGVIKLTLWGFGIDPVIWPVPSWRKVVLGKTMPKDEVRLAVYQRYGVDLKDMNQLEAFCVATAEFLAVHGAGRPRPKKSRKLSD